MHPTLETFVHLLTVCLGFALPMLSAPGINPAWAQIAGAAISLLGAMNFSAHSVRVSAAQAMDDIATGRIPSTASPLNPGAPSLSIPSPTAPVIK